MDAPAGQKQGRIGRALVRLFMKRALVVTNEALSDRFRLVTLESSSFEGVEWLSGQKVQIAMGSAFAARTYTPFAWDATKGRTQILGFAHGDGPGSAWLMKAKEGDECDLLGPRGSLDLRHLQGPLTLFGDETSLGLAVAASRQDPTRSATYYIEVADVLGAGLVVERLGLPGVRLFAREAGDAHLVAMEAMLPTLAATGATFILTGRAGTVQRLRQALKRHGVGSTRIMTKAYWAPGKVGLD